MCPQMEAELYRYLHQPERRRVNGKDYGPTERARQIQRGE